MGRIGDWITRRYLDDRSLRVASIAVIAIALILLAIGFATAEGGQTAFGSELGADYAGFYTAATILNERSPHELYDFELQDRIYHRTLPGIPSEYTLPYVHPPFVAAAFRPLALLPYSWSFLVWLLISACLYLSGLCAIGKMLRNFPSRTRSTGLLLALSFEPFIMECWLAGQLSALGFCLIALALLAHSRGRPTLSGFLFGLCLYKPTLLVLILPMLVIARCWRHLLGFAMSGAILAIISLATVGWQTCENYAHIVFGFASVSTGSRTVFQVGKYVDLNSFLKLLTAGSGTTVVWVVFAAAAGCFLPFLARAWWRLDRSTDHYRQLVMASTLTGTLVFNIYVGVYDAILVVLAVILTADALYRRAPETNRSTPPFFKLLLVLLWMTPWFSQFVARETGFQPYTLVLAAVGAYQLVLARIPTETPRVVN